MSWYYKFSFPENVRNHFSNSILYIYIMYSELALEGPSIVQPFEDCANVLLISGIGVHSQL